MSFPGAFSIGSSQRAPFFIKTDSPGPGAYVVEQVIGMKKADNRMKFSKSARGPVFVVKDIPGPSDFNNDKKCVLLQHPAYTIPHHQSQITKEVRVGPGSYNLEVRSTKANAASYTFQSKFEEIAKQSLNYPGPAHYVSPKVKPQKKCTFGSGDKDGLYKQDNVVNPGVGEYDIKMTRNSEIKFAQSLRNTVDSITPGVGSFNITKSMILRQGSTIALRNEKLNTESSNYPGPGSYKLQSFVDEEKGIKIGKAIRLPRYGNEGPSPLDYVINSDGFPKSVKFTTSQRKSMAINIGNPGPGNYNIAGNSNSGPQFIIPQAVKGRLQMNMSPGPSDYAVNDSMISKKSPSMIMKDPVQQKKKFTINPKLAGPGSYDQVEYTDDGPKFSFGQDERMKQESSILSEPQVGKYNLDSTLGKLPQYLQRVLQP